MLTNQVSDVDIQPRRRYSQSLKPCGLQKLLLNHRSSFCWIYLLLLTLSIIRSSPPSHHWASQGFHFTGLNPISLAGPSRWPGEGRNPEQINWSLGFLRGKFLDHSSSPHTLHHWVPSPSYLDPLMTIYIPSRSLRSASEQRLVVPSQRGTKSCSRTFPFTVPGWFLTIFKRHLKPHLFRLHLISASSSS